VSQYKEVDVGSIVYFWFAANDTTGAAGDGASPTFVVRLAGAAAGAAKVASGTPTLLTHADYSDGSYEIAINSTGYTPGSEYAVFCSLTISTVNPNGFVGSFIVRAAASSAYEYLTTLLGRIVGTLDSGTHKPQSGDGYAIVAHADYGNAKLVRSTTPANTLSVDASHLVAVPDGQKVDVNTIKAKGVTCANDITVLANVGFAGAPGANAGAPTTDGTKINQTVDLTAGQSIACSDKTGFSLSATGADLILKSSTFVQAIVAAINELATYGLTALNTLLVTTGIKAATVPNVTLANGAHGGAAATITLQTPIASTVPDTQKVDLNTIKGRAITDPGGTVAIGTNVAQVGSVMGKSPATLAAGDVTGNLPADVKAYTVQPTVAGATLDAVYDAAKSAYTGTPPTAGEIADAVLDEAGTGHTGLIPTNLDAKVSSRSSHSAADVWAVTARTLTGFGTLVADVAAAAYAAVSAVFSAALVAIQGKTDQLTFTETGKVDATAEVSLSEEQVTAIADAVVDGLGTVGDPLSAAVPGAYPAGTAGAALGRVGSGQITTVSPVSQGGIITLVQGDDYPSGILAWTETDGGWPSLAGASIRLAMTGSATFTGAVLSSAAPQRVGVVLTAAQTRALRAGALIYSLEATLADGTHRTLARGRATVLHEIVV
jgi:hypothetical protein